MLWTVQPAKNGIKRTAPASRPKDLARAGQPVTVIEDVAQLNLQLCALHCWDLVLFNLCQTDSPLSAICNTEVAVL